MKWLKIILVSIAFLGATAMVLLFSGCSQQKSGDNLQKHRYQCVNIDANAMQVRAEVYVPVYSDIYHIDGTRKFALTATLSIRNASTTDIFYVYSIEYYDSDGRLLRNYLDSAIIVKPMHSVEFVVENKESDGGAGANFIVKWAAEKKVTNPVIQAVMIGTESKQGISFAVDGITTNYMCNDSEAIK